MPTGQQWLEETTGRVAADGYAWLQAVHWVIGSGLYTPQRSHGPREMGPTTVRLAKFLAELSPCRPGIDYLVRRLGVGERTVQYHLDMLREAGLLAYIERGTRCRSQRAQASQFALVIPPAFDTALGVRIAGHGSQRRMTGIASAGRTLIAMLGRRAAHRTARAAKAKAAASPRPSAPSLNSSAASAASCRCTPMEGGCCTCSADGSPILPPEGKLADGNLDHGSTGNCNVRSPYRRAVNRVGRRYQLAAELVRQVPWLQRAAVPRIAWVIKDLADAGWTVDEVLGWLDTTHVPDRIRRPSAFLAARVKAAHLVIVTAEQRSQLAESRRDSRRAAVARHAEWDGAWCLPTSLTVQRRVALAMAAPIHGSGAVTVTVHGPDDPDVLLEDLTRAEVADLRALAHQTPDLVRFAIEVQGEAYARRLYTNAVVDGTRALRRQAVS
ncbi:MULTISPECIES: helix-turn-helix domain-containing protein [Streptacidiphilus]|uniref:Transcriptional regulator n=1 Tax=Streptacidiphilus cavernicola TaxID=3342716 RepID=A0ABV6UW96_9ACTN|nr:helix-turn-helix domain-containing protein [Streptacidiphilus jeojiense]